MRNYGECLPNNCLNWLALGACIYNGKKIDTVLRMVGLKGVKETVEDVSDEEIVSMYQSGLSMAKIKMRTGIQTTNIKPILIKAGVYQLKAGALAKQNAYKDVDVAEIIKLRQSGLSLRKIGAKMGVSRATVQKRLIKVGLE
ncbi:MAG: helix-turn-helix domain-containing protein [Solobacterium sp.]|nr:helix-turn-helix domain-containing protein [Solobacterium sp.]